MALDGIFLSKIKNEIISEAVGTRIDKINQPARDEIVINLRGKGKNLRLLLCARADSPRVHFLSQNIENPATPPMFCMLLRKHLSGALLEDVRQLSSDRVLFFDFLATNEIGDKVRLTLCIEVMGKCSNIILFDQNKRIIDCAKRVDITTSSVRQLLPGLQYEYPPLQNKLNILQSAPEQIADCVLERKNEHLSSAILKTVEGISPIVSREISSLVLSSDDFVSAVSDKNKLITAIKFAKNCAETQSNLYVLLDESKKPKDMSFVPVFQYGNSYELKEFSSPSELVESFYYERDKINRINHRGKELIKLISNLIERTSKKLTLQRAELKECENKENLRLFGELITSNLYSLSKGSFFYEVPNYYDDMNMVRIPVNPAFTPTENANKYYKDYRKAKKAEEMLQKLIVEGEAELVYLESVLDEISRAETDSEMASIRLELISGGYVKDRFSKKRKPPKELPPMEFFSTDGYRILVGRNNLQNDKLWMKIAHGNDVWLHVQGSPGSHVVVFCKQGEILDGEEFNVSDTAILEAAALAVKYSKVSNGSLVPVDYTKVRNLKKPNGAKPGKVIYHEYYTLIVTNE